jgi:hypothetical protein
MDYDKLATKESIDATVNALQNKGYEAFVLENGAQALEKIKSMISAGASVNNGASQTLEQIGYIDYLKSGNHGWNNLKDAIVKETDPQKQAVLRKQSVISDYYLGSCHALVENGEFIIASNSGSQLPHIVFTSQNLIFVVSTKKIVPTLDQAMDRLKTYVAPLEDDRMMKASNVHTNISKLLIFRDEAKFLGRKITLLLVNESLGF